MNAFATGLSALTHPAALAAILLLLLNDHVLKRYFPSELTGKLSDFAGLLFFPLLLSALIGLLEHKPRRAAGWGFALTGLAFAALKLSPPAAGWASASLGWLFGANVVITPDPTDLSALVMLIPSGLLWQRAPRRRFDPRMGYAALVVGSLASVATSPCMPPTLITRLAQAEGVIYAWGGGSVYQSEDDGLTWQEKKDNPEALLAQLQTKADLPRVTCENANPLRCYRIGVKDLTVEFSEDGGQNWRVDWQIPAGRLAFMNRSRSGILACEREVIGGPFDLLINPQGAVVVAMGNEGVLAGSAGSWQRIAVGRTSGPTPFRETHLSDAWAVVVWEVLASIVIGYLFWIGLTFRAANRAAHGQHGGIVFIPLWVLVLGLAILVFLFLNSAVMRRVDPILFFGIFGLCIFFLPVFTWWLALRRAVMPGAFRRAGTSAFGWSLLLVPALGIPFIAWALGFPPFYWLAVLIALGLGVWVGQKGARSVLRQVQVAVMPRSVEEVVGPG